MSFLSLGLLDLGMGVGSMGEWEEPLARALKVIWQVPKVPGSFLGTYRVQGSFYN